jgi:hypothetical protein
MDRAAQLQGAMRTKRIRGPLEPGEIEFFQRDRRRQDPIARLSRQFDEVAKDAVDPAEIAAGMEAAGLNDRIARAEYHEDSVFRLAELVFAAVPRKNLSLLALDYDPWRRPFWSHLSRGLLYALPTLPYIVAISLSQGSVASIWLLVATCVVSTALTQGLAHIAHLLLGYGSRRGAVRVLRIALAAVVGLGAVLTYLLTTRTSVGVVAAGIAYGVLVYVVAATVLMVFKREGLLMATLLPGVLLCLGFLAFPHIGSSAAVVVYVGLILFMLAVLLVAVRVLADEARPRGPSWARIAPAEWRMSLLYATYGGIAAALMTYAIVDVLQFATVIGTESLIDVGMLPLILSLGFAEASVYGFRSESAAALASSFTQREFAPAARRILAHRLLAYTAALVVLTLVVLVPRSLWIATDSLTVMRHVVYAVLGVALLGAMMLVSCGLAPRATVILGVGLLVDMTARTLVSGGVMQMTLAHLVVFLGLSLVVWIVAFRELAFPLRHR